MKEKNPQKYISSIFYSIELINDIINLKSINDEDKSTIIRNIQFLEIMLKEEWILKELTRSQFRKITNCITNGNLYIT